MESLTQGERVGAQFSLWIAALWWGSLSTVGFLVVPLLFAHLPSPAIAGAMAAKLFTSQTWVALVCGLLLLMLGRRKSEASTNPLQAVAIWIMAAMLLALLSEFAVAPRIVMRQNLALWHTVGSLMYLAHWLCAAIVFLKLAQSTIEDAAASGRPKQSTVPSGGQS